MKSESDLLTDGLVPSETVKVWLEAKESKAPSLK